MGNVHAAAPPPPPFFTQLPTPPKSEEVKTLGTMEELHKKCKDIFPNPFEGGRFLFSRSLSNHFQISHTVTMSQVASGYKFGCAYAGTNFVTPTETFPLLIGEISPDGDLNANIICRFHPSITSKAIVQIQKSKCMGLQISNEYKNENSCTSLVVTNPDIIDMSAVTMLQYLQKVTPTVDLGTEIALQTGRLVPGGIFSTLTVCGRYTSSKNYILSGTLSLDSRTLNLCYYQKASENLKFGVEVITSLKLEESSATVGYQVDLPQAGSVFKGSVDSNYCVAGVLEKKLSPLPFTLSLSGLMTPSPLQTLYRFGIGLTLG